jgi:hypothetical protein
MGEKMILIRYAEITDYSWLKEHDKNISDEILKIKIDAKEVYIVQELDEAYEIIFYKKI